MRKALICPSLGPAENLRVTDIEAPIAGDDEALVKIAYAGLNFFDTLIIEGKYQVRAKPPFSPGGEFSGHVVALGPGAQGFKVGDRVWGSNQGMLGRQGATAEYAAIDEDFAYPTPLNQPDAEAAGQALVGITAHLGLFRTAHLKEGETVYIPGGSGGVGHQTKVLPRRYVRLLTIDKRTLAVLVLLAPLVALGCRFAEARGARRVELTDLPAPGSDLYDAALALGARPWSRVVLRHLCSVIVAKQHLDGVLIAHLWRDGLEV